MSHEETQVHEQGLSSLSRPKRPTWTEDSALTEMYTHVRHVRLADGPDIVHLNTIAKEELKKKSSVMGGMVSGTNKNIKKYGKFDKVTPRIGSRL